MKSRTYSELIQYDMFEARFDYLALGGQLGEATFGFDRWINQAFYRSAQWRSVRQHIILRDCGCDLGVPGYEINGGLVVHHINPMVSTDISHSESWILDPEFLIATTIETHNAIHYGNRENLRTPRVDRSPGDTKLW